MTNYMAHYLEKKAEEEAKPLSKPLRAPRRPNGRADRQARAIKTSAPIKTHLGGQVEVVTRTKSEHQLAPEISLRHIGVETISMSPASARALAQELLAAARHAEGDRPEDAIKGVLERAGTWVSRTEVREAVTSTLRGVAGEILDDLVADGVVESREGEKAPNGKIPVLYRLT